MYEGLTAGKADAVLAASIFHFREISIRQVKEELARRGVPVRPQD
jgi:cyclase